MTRVRPTIPRPIASDRIINLTVEAKEAMFNATWAAKFVKAWLKPYVLPYTSNESVVL